MAPSVFVGRSLRLSVARMVVMGAGVGMSLSGLTAALPACVFIRVKVFIVLSLVDRGRARRNTVRTAETDC